MKFSNSVLLALASTAYAQEIRPRALRGNGAAAPLTTTQEIQLSQDDETVVNRERELFFLSSRGHEKMMEAV